ncbi:MAG: WD40/YVTN/BNR-like repeat-containing protein [Anaerolineae bacterium]
MGTAILVAVALFLLPAGWQGRELHGDTPQVRWIPLEQGLESHATILALASNPSEPRLLYAGAYHQVGLYVSRDGGEHWQASAVGIEGRVVYDLLVVPPGEPGRATAYAGAADGLYRSEDTGRSWSRVEDVPAVAVFALAQDGLGRVYCGTDGHGIYRGPARTSPEGADAPAYTHLTLGDLTTDGVILALAASEDGRTLLAGTNGWGAAVSVDGGTTWRASLEEEFISEVALSPQDPQTAYARTRNGLYRTGDGGASWTLSSQGIEKRIDALAVDPLDPQAIYVGVSGSGVWRSKDGGATWQKTGPGIRPWAAILDLLVVRQPELVLYAGAWDGVYRSTDEGQTWQRLNQGLGQVQVRALTPHPTNPEHLFAVDVDGLHASTDGGATWSCLSPGPLDKGYLSVAFSASNPQIGYAGSDGGGVARTADGGRTWEVLDSTLKAAMADLLVHPSDPERLLARVSFSRVYESTDGGVTWTPRWEGMGLEREATALAMDPRDPAIIYAGTDEGLYMTHDGGQNWQPLGATLTRRTIYCILVDPDVSSSLYVGTTDGPFRSDDAGNTWQRWGRGLEFVTVTRMAFDPRDHRTVYAGTKYEGMYRSLDGGKSWHLWGLAGASIESLVVHPSGSPLLVATSRGLYRGEVSR